MSCSSSNSESTQIDSDIIADGDRFWRDTDSNIIVCKDTIFYTIKNSRYHGYLSFPPAQDTLWHSLVSDASVVLFNPDVPYFICGDVLVVNQNDFKLPVHCKGFYKISNRCLWLKELEFLENDVEVNIKVPERIRL